MARRTLCVSAGPYDSRLIQRVTGALHGPVPSVPRSFQWPVGNPSCRGREDQEQGETREQPAGQIAELLGKVLRGGANTRDPAACVS